MSRSHTRELIVNACLTGSAPVQFLTGEAGMGKSTMLRSVKEIIVRTDPSVRIADVDCSAPLAGVNVGAVEALYPWVQLMRELATEAPTSQTKQLVTDLARAWIKFIPIVGDLIESTVDTVAIVKQHRSQTTPVEPASSREHVFHQCIGFFRALAMESRVVIIIDDAHWADDSSLNLLFALARASEGNIVCIVAYRPDDVRTSRLGGEHTLLHIRRELERYDLCSEIVLPPMTSDELLEIAGADNVDITRLMRYCGGNPFLAQGYSTERSLPKARASIEAVIAEKISRLDDEQRDLLAMAAVEGETFTSLVLRSLSPLPPLHIAQVLRKAEQDHMLVRSLGKCGWYVTETATYEFANDAIHIALERAISDEERELLHAAVADVLRSERDAAVIDGSDAQHIDAKLAVHTERGGSRTEAAEIWLSIAERAWSLYAEREARHALAEVLRVCDVAATSKPLRILRGKGLCLRGMIDQFVRRVTDAVDAFEEAVQIGRSVGDKVLEVTALCRRAAAANVAGDPEGVRVSASEALNLSIEIKYVLGELAATSMMGMWNESNGDLDAAEECFMRSLALAVESGEINRRANALVNIGRIRIHRDDLSNSIPCCLEAAELFGSLKKWDGMARALNNAGIAYAAGEQFAEATRVYGQALELHERIGDIVGGSSLRTNLAQLYLRQGDLETAHNLIATSISTKRTLQDGYGLAIALYTKGLIEIEEMNISAARVSLEESRTIAVDVREQMVIDEIDKAIASIPAL
ncbi:MAG: tetratricopeptide repeat protein [Candidatus Kapabacteria bacterium]|nr:tetratricopeptide repeat protein [Candidatus Kapabacteria bacterium]